MIIIGCDFHTRHQQIAMDEETTGELLFEPRLDHKSGETQAFYRNFSVAVRVGSRPLGLFPGSSGCSQSSVTNCGSSTPGRFAPVMGVNKACRHSSAT